MRSNRLMRPILIGLGLLIIAGCAPPTTTTPSLAQITALTPGMARVWFLRQPNPPSREAEAATPMIYANGTALADSKEGTAFFHDFPPGSYKFTVQAYGTPAGESDRLQLAPGMQSYLQVQAVPNWEQGSSAGGWSFAPLTMSPQLAQQYLPTMTNLGRR